MDKLNGWYSNVRFNCELYLLHTKFTMRSPQDLLNLMESSKGSPTRHLRELELMGVLGRWPKYTPVNVFPLVQFIAISPGGSPGKSPVDGSTSSSAYMPELLWGGAKEAAIAFSDDRDSNNYWRKIANLGSYIVGQYLGPESDIDPRRLLAHINLSEVEDGKGGNVEFLHPMTTWVPEVTYRLQARVIICCGNRTHLSGHNFSIEDFQVDWSVPSLEIPFYADGKNYKIQLWFAQIKSEETLVVSLPNHPSKHPFGGLPENNKHWDQLKNGLKQFLPGLPGSQFGKQSPG